MAKNIENIDNIDIEKAIKEKDLKKIDLFFESGKRLNYGQVLLVLSNVTYYWSDNLIKNELLKKCLCFVMPSRNEGFGLVYLEAMRLGKPCLVSDCDAGREVVSIPGCGFSVSVMRENYLVNCIECQILTNAICDYHIVNREVSAISQSSVSYQVG